MWHAPGPNVGRLSEAGPSPAVHIPRFVAASGAVHHCGAAERAAPQFSRAQENVSPCKGNCVLVLNKCPSPIHSFPRLRRCYSGWLREMCPFWSVYRTTEVALPSTGKFDFRRKQLKNWTDWNAVSRFIQMLQTFTVTVLSSCKCTTAETCSEHVRCESILAIYISLQCHHHHPHPHPKSLKPSSSNTLMVFITVLSGGIFLSIYFLL